MLLLAGLGNPGAEYAATRHNIGFMAVDAIVRRHGFGPWRSRFQGQIAEGRLGEDKVLALKPMTFMNLAGDAVGDAMRFFRLEPADLVVFHDDLDLAPGKLRMKQGGGHAGHNGLRSLDAHIGADYRRCRLGIGRPGERGDRVIDYVLHPFAKADGAWLNPLLDALAEAAPLLTAGKDAAFASKIALILHPPPAKPAAPGARPDKAAKSTPKEGGNGV